MADSLIVKLGADTSEFRGELNKAAQAGGEFTRGFGNALDGLGKKFGNLRSLGGALAVALGINFQAIAERLARFVIGFSELEEAALKALVDKTDKLADEAEKRRDKARDEAARKEAEYSRMIADQQKLVWEARMQYFENEKKMREDMAKLAAKGAAEEQKQINRNLEEIAKLKFDALKPEEKLIQLKKEQLELEKVLRADKKAGIETSEIELEILKNTTAQEQIRLGIVKEITAEKEKGAKVEMKAAGDLGVAKSIGGIKVSSDPGRQYDYDQALIAAATRDNQREIETLQKTIDRYQQGGAGIGKFELPALMARLKALQSRRDNIRDYVFDPNYSDAAGQGIFASQVSTIGDPLGLQKKQTDVLQNVSSGVAELNTRLRMAGFGTGG